MKIFTVAMIVLTWTLFKGNGIEVKFRFYPEQGVTATSKVCTTEHLFCENGEHIYILSVSFYKGKVTCQQCDCLNTTLDDLEVDEESNNFKYILYRSCSFKSSCNIYNSDEILTPNINFSWIASVNYNCVSADSLLNMCSKENRILWETPLHVVLHDESFSNQSCVCEISRSSEIIIVDYRTYCSANHLSINGLKKFLCRENYFFIEVFNVGLEIINMSTTIEYNSYTQRLEMLWIKITGPNSTTIRCNNNETKTTPNMTTSISTPAISTALTTLQFPNKNFTEIGTQHTTYMASVSDEHTLSTYPQKVTLNQETNSSESKKTPPIAIIVGGSVAVFIVVLMGLTVLVVIRRKRALSRGSSNKENVYSSVRFNNTANPSTLMNGVLNLTYETNDIRCDRAYLNSPDRNDSNENAEPFDATFTLESLEIVKPKVDRNIQPLSKEQANDEFNSSKRQSEVTKNRVMSASSVSYTNVTKPNKSKIDAEPETSENKDDYSSVHINQKNSFPNQTDNYSHILLDSNQISEDISGDKYINIRYLANNQKSKNTKDDYSHINLKLLENKTNNSKYKGSYDEYSHINTSQLSNHVDSEGQRDRPSVHDYYNVDITEYNHLCFTSTHSEL